MPMLSEANPMRTDNRVQWTTLARTSRPFVSVPKMLPSLNIQSRGRNAERAGSSSGRNEANSAMITIATSQASASHPPKPSFAFLATVAASPGEALARPGAGGAAAVVVSGAAMSDPWVDDGVEEVDDAVDEQVGHGDERHAALQGDVLAPEGKEKRRGGQ